MARSDERPYPHGSGREERQSHWAKGPPPEGFRQKCTGAGVASQSQVHGGHAPSSRLVGGAFLAKQQYPEFFNGLLAFHWALGVFSRHTVTNLINTLVTKARTVTNARFPAATTPKNKHETEGANSGNSSQNVLLLASKGCRGRRIFGRKMGAEM